MGKESYRISAVKKVEGKVWAGGGGVHLPESMIRPLRDPQTRGVLFHVHRLLHEKSPMRDKYETVLSDRLVKSVKATTPENLHIDQSTTLSQAPDGGSMGGAILLLDLGNSNLVLFHGLRSSLDLT